MNGLALQAAEKDLVKLRGSLYEMEVKYNSSADHSRKELDAAEHRHKLEIDALHKTLHGMRMDFEQERDRIQSQSDKLLQHEKQLAVAQEELRKKELEVSSRVQEIKIETEDKYRVGINVFCLNLVDHHVPNPSPGHAGGKVQSRDRDGPEERRG